MKYLKLTRHTVVGFGINFQLVGSTLISNLFFNSTLLPFSVSITEDGKKALLRLARGDMRRSLNILQVCSFYINGRGEGGEWRKKVTSFVYLKAPQFTPLILDLSLIKILDKSLKLEYKMAKKL